MSAGAHQLDLLCSEDRHHARSCSHLLGRTTVSTKQSKLIFISCLVKDSVPRAVGDTAQEHLIVKLQVDIATGMKPPQSQVPKCNALSSILLATFSSCASGPHGDWLNKWVGFDNEEEELVKSVTVTCVPRWGTRHRKRSQKWHCPAIACSVNSFSTASAGDSLC